MWLTTLQRLYPLSTLEHVFLTAFSTIDAAPQQSVHVVRLFSISFPLLDFCWRGSPLHTLLRCGRIYLLNYLGYGQFTTSTFFYDINMANPSPQYSRIRLTSTPTLVMPAHRFLHPHRRGWHPALLCCDTALHRSMSHSYHFVADHWPPRLVVGGWVKLYHRLYLFNESLQDQDRNGRDIAGSVFVVMLCSNCVYTWNISIWLFFQSETWIVCLQFSRGWVFENLILGWQ